VHARGSLCRARHGLWGEASLPLYRDRRIAKQAKQTINVWTALRGFKSRRCRASAVAAGLAVTMQAPDVVGGGDTWGATKQPVSASGTSICRQPYLQSSRLAHRPG